MLEGKRVSVVVPAHNEERLSWRRSAGIPEFVDRIYVVDDPRTTRPSSRCVPSPIRASS